MQSNLLSQDGNHGKHHGRQDRYIGIRLFHVAIYIFNLGYEPQRVLLDLGSINLGPFLEAMHDSIERFQFGSVRSHIPRIVDIKLCCSHTWSKR